MDECEFHKPLKSCLRTWCPWYIQTPNNNGEGGEYIRLKAKLCGNCVKYTGGLKWTLEEIAFIEGISCERVRQIEEHALAKFKALWKHSDEYEEVSETEIYVYEQIQTQEEDEYGDQIG